MDVKKTPWEEYFRVLCKIYEDQGSVNIVYNAAYEIDGLAIGRWVYRQRNLYSIGKMRQDRIEKLERIGFAWKGKDVQAQRNKDYWEKVFVLAETYYKENGNLRIPRHYIINGIDVGNWLSNLKCGYKRKNRRILTEYQIAKLESIGIEWDYDYLDDLWNKMYQCAELYFRNFGNIFITQGVDFEGLPLGNWIHDQTQLYKKHKLSQERIDKLNKLGIRWSPQRDKWQTYYKYAKKFYQEIGNLEVPYDFEIDGISLGRWISVQRQAYNGRQDTIITDEQIKKLEAIGMSWKGEATSQTSFLEQIIYFYLVKLYPSTINRYNEYGFELDIYVPEFKIAIEYDGYFWHKDKLDRDNIKDLLCRDNNISLIRIREHQLPPTQVAHCYLLEDYSILTFQKVLVQCFAECFKANITIDIKKDCFEIVKGYKVQANSPWYKAFLEAKAYFEENGHLIVPNSFITPSGLNLAFWIKRQRQCYKGNQKPLSAEQIALLDSIGMQWNPYQNSWEEGYSYAKMYYEEFDNLLVPQELVYKGFSLGKWINSQRTHKDRFSSSYPERIHRLEQIGMVWNSIDNQWHTGYLFAKEYYNIYGNLLIPSDYITPSGFKLGIWIQTQRKLKKEKKQYDIQSKVELLDSIGMIWDILEHQWNQGYTLAQKYYKENGDLLVPQNFITNGFRLGAWIGNLRQSVKNNKISQERLEQLKSIGMIWNTADYSWEKHYSLACDYFKEFGTINIPSRTCYKDIDLGTWLKNLRTAKKKGRKTYLTDERIKLLDALGMNW